VTTSAAMRRTRRIDQNAGSTTGAIGGPENPVHPNGANGAAGR
jgi:hypothetical protein